MDLCVKENFIQFIKFNIVGIINTAVTFGIYSFVVFLLDNHFIGLACDYFFGIIISFALNKKVTFNNGSKTSVFMITKMILAYVPSIILNIVLLYIFVDIANWNKYMAQFITMFLIAFISFLMQKFFVFKQEKRI